MTTCSISQLFRSYITDNPVLIRELRVLTRTKLVMWSILVYLAVLFTGILILGPCFASTSHPEIPIFTIYSCIQTLTVLLLTSALSVGSITKEYKTGTIEQALIAGLSGLQILTGKVLAITTAISGLLALSLPFMFILLICDIGNIGDLHKLIPLYLLCIVFCFAFASIGILSSKPRKISSLNTCSYYILPFQIFIFLCLHILIFELLYPWAHPWTLYTVPAAAFVSERINIAGYTMPTFTIAFIFWLLVGIVNICIKAHYIAYSHVNNRVIDKAALSCLLIYVFWLAAGDKAYHYMAPTPEMGAGIISFVIMFLSLFWIALKPFSPVYRDAVHSESLDFLQILIKSWKEAAFILFLTSFTFITAVVSYNRAMIYSSATYNPIDNIYLYLALLCITTFVIAINCIALLSACLWSERIKILILPSLYWSIFLLAISNYPGYSVSIIPDRSELIKFSIINAQVIAFILTAAFLYRPAYKGIHEIEV